MELIERKNNLDRLLVVLKKNTIDEQIKRIVNRIMNFTCMPIQFDQIFRLILDDR